ncbi:hypothetical protein CPC08DRAFT_814926 [Agrocybe pediades]|nr:hypothetical protein CPC08DRAFT_814926 [Agrocybe pediades]
MMIVGNKQSLALSFMPSTTLQSRIQAFESLTHPNTTPSILEGPLSPLAAATLQPVAVPNKSRPKPPQPSPSPSPPNLGRKTSFIDLHDWVVAEQDGNKTAISIERSPSPSSSKTPTQQAFKPKPKPKPANLSAPLKSPPKLPPRNTSYTSLQSYASSSSSPPTASTSKSAEGRKDSLTVEYAHRYPPLAPGLRNGNSSGGSHVPSSSISSFHSVSLSSDTDPSTPGSMANFIATFPMDEADNTSLSESYEDVSASSIASPATERIIALDWEKAMAKRKPPPPWDSKPKPNVASPAAAAKRVPPKLPERPKVTPPPSYPVSRSSSYNTTPTSLNSPAIPNVPYTPRRSAPPPPSRSSDRASIQSTTTTTSYASSSRSPSVLSLNLVAKTKRPTPVPAAARRRYDAVFTENVIQRRRAEKMKAEEKPALLSPVEARGKRAVGWRGLSVDLITGDSLASPPQNSKVDETVGNDEKLEGAIVKLIWKRSKLSNAQLAEIWNECDITGQGVLSREAFVKGMWRIDEELRRAQTQAIKAATSSNNSNFYRTSSLLSLPSRTSTRSRDILR